MPRASEKVAEIEAARLAVLQAEQRKMRARLTREIKVKKAGAHLPGEEQLKKHMAVYLKIGVPGISYTDIANRLGEHKGTIKRWFKEDPDVKDFYDYILNNLKEGTLALMKTYSLEAVETLVLLMRFGSEKYMFESAREILDRVGVPKISRSEVETEHTDKFKWEDKDELVAQIRELPPDMQEEAIAGLERLQEMLAQSKGHEVDPDSVEPGLIPIINDGDDDEDEGEPSEDDES